jgi:antitoxin YefM
MDPLFVPVGPIFLHYVASATKKRSLPETINGLAMSSRVPPPASWPFQAAFSRLIQASDFERERTYIDICIQSVHICVHSGRSVTLAHVRLTEFRQNIATHFDNVIASRAPLLVTRQGSEALVLIAEGEYESMQETLHLLSTPANSDRLRESIAQLRRGELIEKDPTL